MVIQLECNFEPIWHNGIERDKAEKDFCIDKSSDSVINEPFNMEELNHAIDSAKCTSPGKDGISNTVIKHFPIHIRKYLLIIFNMIWYTSQCPQTMERCHPYSTP